ncbi:MAG: hypothetical protein M1812_004197 [Candelaria pacifica]|nr:MAG: hypothetical protein M1812_004197 [Candelaria pacifica]
MGNDGKVGAKRKDDRIIIHFDYDCFYASVFEAENPALKSLPLAVQQKQIIVTCNYEARRRGLHKLQLIKEARKVCPDAIIVLGEDLTRFRNASKALYSFLRAPIWSGKVERLGFDEVFMDVTDMVAYNVELLNRNDLPHSFFQLSRDDPILGFSYDATSIAGYPYPSKNTESLSSPPSHSALQFNSAEDWLRIGLMLGSHLAQYLRHQLDEQLGYTSAVGISTSKLLAKLVGSVNKPKGQTTLMPPYLSAVDGPVSNVTTFIDAHDIGRIPGIGFKIAQKIRSHLLGRPGEFDAGLVYGGTKEKVFVGDVRKFPGLDQNRIEAILGGSGAPQGIGAQVWGLINGIDDSEVGKARSVPRQISIEDSYIRLDTMDEVRKELALLSRSLVKRMHMDLLTHDEDDGWDELEEAALREDQHETTQQSRKKWIAQPRTLRLTTRPRPPLNADGTRSRTFNRISRSSPMPSFILNLDANSDSIADKLVSEALIPLFRKLHPEKSGWNLSLVNVAAMSMAETAGDGKDGAGRDIGRMLKRQETVLKEWRVEDIDIPPTSEHDELEVSLENQKYVLHDRHAKGTEDLIEPSQESYVEDGEWENAVEALNPGSSCPACGAVMPEWAMAAHERFHAIGD